MNMKKSTWKPLFTLCFIIWGFVVGFAQISAVKKTVNGVEYYVHTIEKGQTIYGISRIYSVTDKDIFEANPGTESGIRAGEVLLIPIKKSAKEEKPVMPQPSKINGEFITHQVERGETLYGLSKKYEVSVDDILNANAGLPEGLKVGAVVRIPKKGVIANQKSDPKQNTQDVSKEDDENDFSKETDRAPSVKVDDIPMRFKSRADCVSNAVKKNDYRVALLLPLGNNPKPENKQARVAFQFLGGIETAKLLYPPAGVSIRWEVFNTGEQDDSLQIKKLLDSGGLKEFDIIVGPLYASGLAQVADFAASNKIPLLSPTVRSSSILSGNPYVIKGAASPESFGIGLADYIRKKFDNVVLFYPSNSADSLHVSQLYTELRKLNGLTIHQAYAGKNSPMDFVKAGAENLIYYPVRNELTVSNFLTGLRNVKKSDRITVMGDESWLRFRNFDPDYFNLVNLQIPVNLYSSNEIDELRPFVKAFRDNFKTAPEVYAYKGFDAACFVTDMLESFGSSLPECITFESPRYTMAPFKLKKIPGGGFENYGILVVRVENYKLLLETN